MKLKRLLTLLTAKSMQQGPFLLMARIGVFFLLAVFGLQPAQSAAPGNHYRTGGGQVTIKHLPSDEGVYYATPSLECAYNVQIIRNAGTQNYFVGYHSEPNKGCCYHIGDGFKTGTKSGAFGYTMPVNKNWRLWGVPDDNLSIIYSTTAGDETGMSGPGNCMIVKGIGGDPYWYGFFLATTDDNLNRQGNDFREWLWQGRSLDFINWDIKTGNGSSLWWTNFPGAPNPWKRPAVLMDTAGGAVMSAINYAPGYEQGLIGSICYVNGLYYYFYADKLPDGKNYLMYRTASNISSLTLPGFWSPAQAIVQVMEYSTIRVAKAKGMNRWAVLYNAYRAPNPGQPASLAQGLALQYTTDLSIASIAQLPWYDYWFPSGNNTWTPGALGVNNTHNLNLNSGTDTFAQQSFMTDEYGNLAVPAEEDGTAKGGMLTWMAMTSGPYGSYVQRAGWEAQVEPATGWKLVNGSLTNISVGGNGHIWGVDSYNNIFKWNGTTGITNSWILYPGGLKQVSVGNDGEVWGTAVGDSIWRWNGSAWQQYAGGLRQVSVGSAGNIWGVNSGDFIYRWNGSVWNNIPGYLSYIDAGTTSSDHAWGVNAAGNIFRYNGSTWETKAGILYQISARNYSIAVGNNGGWVYRTTDGGGTFNLYPGQMKEVSEGSDGTLWGIDFNKHVWRYQY